MESLFQEYMHGQGAPPAAPAAVPEVPPSARPAATPLDSAALALKNAETLPAPPPTALGTVGKVASKLGPFAAVVAELGNLQTLVTSAFGSPRDQCGGEACEAPTVGVFGLQPGARIDVMNDPSFQ